MNTKPTIEITSEEYRLLPGKPKTSRDFPGEFAASMTVANDPVRNDRDKEYLEVFEFRVLLIYAAIAGVLLIGISIDYYFG